MSLRMPAIALAVLIAAMLSGCGQDDGTTTTVVIKTPSATSGPAVDNSANEDADAKSDARNAVSQAESCATETASYADCANDPELAPAVMTASDATTYTVMATSLSGAKFSIAKTASGDFERTCTGDNPVSCAGGTW